MKSKLTKMIVSLCLVATLIPLMGSDCDESYYGGAFGFDYFDGGYGGYDSYGGYESYGYEEEYYEYGGYDGGYYDDGYYGDDFYYDDFWKGKK